MNEKLKDFLKYASENEELAGKFQTIKDETDKGTVIDFTVALAKEHGFELTADDFTHDEMEDDELEAVAGGFKKCACVVGGGSKDDEDGKTCACAIFGSGYRKDDTEKARCVCYLGGYGNESLL